MKELKTKLSNILSECNKHKKRIKLAYAKIEHRLPFNSASYTSLTEDEIAHVDQFLFRYSKLQDAMGEKLFITLLLLLEEPVSNKPFIDILNRLEKLELLYTEDWLRLRKIRNNVAHEYSLESEEIVVSLNRIYESSDLLISIFDGIEEFCENNKIDK